jgi:hypothetical protein
MRGQATVAKIPCSLNHTKTTHTKPYQAKLNFKKDTVQMTEDHPTYQEATTLYGKFSM